MSTQSQKIENNYPQTENNLCKEKTSSLGQIKLEALLDRDSLPQPPKDSLSELIFFNKVDELKERLLNECNPNERDENGLTVSWTPLYWSVKLGNAECVKILLKHGADLNLVINDSEECCGTVLDLVTLRDDIDMEKVLREFAEESNVGLGQSYKAIRTRLRGKAPACSFKYYGNKKT